MGCVEHAPIDAEPEFECVCEAYEYFNERGYATVLCGGLGTVTRKIITDRIQRRSTCIQSSY